MNINFIPVLAHIIGNSEFGDPMTKAIFAAVQSGGFNKLPPQKIFNIHQIAIKQLWLKK
ncbi:hypothetical protein DSECCO2_559620 [anaerobic digester metagenome]|jgi:hypothetical protein